MQNRFKPSKNDLIDPEFSSVLVGQSQIFLEVIHRARCIAEDPATVLILGESGTGKEEMARGIHRLSRRPGPFVAVSCAALPAELAESLLFGHVKGAFTTADRDEAGLIRQSQHGTLFLDEVGDLEMKLQSKLLRVLQEHAVLPVGGKAESPVISVSSRPPTAISGRWLERATFETTVTVVSMNGPSICLRSEFEEAILCWS